MTHSITTPASHTKPFSEQASLQATSRLSKDDKLKGFKDGKLRKNAKSKIAVLLSMATKIVLRTQTMGMDDCFNDNAPQIVDINFFWSWYEKEYSELEIYVTVIDGVLTKVRFSDCPYHFSDDIVLTFEEVKAKKPHFTYAQVKQALLDGYLCPLSNDSKAPEPTPPNDDNTRKVVSFGDFQDRLESKRDRLENASSKAAAESNKFYESSRSLASCIPFGQPILVGHHSEGRARRHADKIFNDMGKSVAASKKAGYYADRAASVGTNGIASDDPEAIAKLKEKLAGLERSQETMKAINKVIRSKHMTDADKIEYMTQTHKLTEKEAEELLKGDFCGRVGFASYSIANNSASIRTVRDRIENLEKLHNQEPLSASGEIEGLSWSLYEEDGRIKITFEDVPSEALRRTLKTYSFKWSRFSKAWVRKITPNAIFRTKQLIAKLGTN